MAVEILGREDGRLEQRLTRQLAEAGIHEITWVDPAILEPHGGWREDGAVVWRTEWEMHGQILPIACINTYFYSFKQAMEKYGPKNITWKVWTPSPAVCSKVIAVAIKDDVIQEVLFSGGCDGNSKCIDRLLYGTSVQMAKHLLGDIICGDKHTSCGRELARGL
ncbi:MAG: TSCPD domain-containing protein [Oscillospiraceae bacterium]|nr:TSCPD domain-containing protein [Oscillospiraceae bacterium]